MVDLHKLCEVHREICSHISLNTNSATITLYNSTDKIRQEFFVVCVKFFLGYFFTFFALFYYLFMVPEKVVKLVWF